MNPISIEPLPAAVWPAVQRIYQAGIDTGLATFETAVPTWATWDSAHLPQPRLLATRQTAVCGWAALSPVSRRPVYAGVAEVSVYIDADYRRQGIGHLLLSALVTASETAGIWTLQAGIFALNEASLSLHQRCGFRVVGCRERLGQLHGQWHDVMLLERRSPLVGQSPAQINECR